MTLPVLQTDRLTLRPVADADVEPLLAILDQPSVRPWWPPADRREDEAEGLFNEGWAFTIEVDGTVAGWLGVSEENDRDYRHAGLDIVLAAEFQDRGLGPEALRTAIRWLIDERGHHRFTIDPALENERAIRAYESVGFRRVGVMRRYERVPAGGWRDSLLLDMLADELTG